MTKENLLTWITIATTITIYFATQAKSVVVRNLLILLLFCLLGLATVALIEIYDPLSLRLSRREETDKTRISPSSAETTHPGPEIAPMTVSEPGERAPSSDSNKPTPRVSTAVKQGFENTRERPRKEAYFAVFENLMELPVDVEFPGSDGAWDHVDAHELRAKGLEGSRLERKTDSREVTLRVIPGKKFMLGAASEWTVEADDHFIPVYSFKLDNLGRITLETDPRHRVSRRQR